MESDIKEAVINEGRYKYVSKRRQVVYGGCTENHN